MQLMFHDDSCGELLDAHGRCPKCEFSPDMQSTGFMEVNAATVKAGIVGGKTFLGQRRKPIRDLADCELSVTDLDRARQIVAQVQEALRTIHIEALREIVGRNQNSSSRVDQSIEEQDWYDLRDLVRVFEETQFRADAFKRRG